MYSHLANYYEYIGKNTTTTKKGPTPFWEKNIFAIQSLFIGKEFFP